MIHSTVSPRSNSIAWATAEGKLIYHCSLSLRLISWTLVGNPIGLLISSYSTRHITTQAPPLLLPCSLSENEKALRTSQRAKHEIKANPFGLAFMD
jgi:hypothetical protein